MIDNTYLVYNMIDNTYSVHNMMVSSDFRFTMYFGLAASMYTKKGGRYFNMFSNFFIHFTRARSSPLALE